MIPLNSLAAAPLELLADLPADPDPNRPQPTLGDVDPFSATADTEWGRLRRLTWPGAIGEARPELGRSHRTGMHQPHWLPNS